MVKPTTPRTPPDDSGSAPLSHEDLFQAYEAVPEFVSVIDSDFNLVFLNSRLKAVVGNLLGKKCYETVLGSGDVCAYCPVKNNWDFEKGPSTQQGTDERGKTWEFTVNKFVERNSGSVYYVSIERDTTEEVQTERKLRTMMASVDQMPDAVCVSDLEGKVIYVNKAYVQLTGYDDKSVAGLSMTDITSGDSSGSTMHTILKAAVGRGWRGEMTGLRKDGTRYYTHVDARPVRDDKGLPIAVVAILRDITRQKSEKVEIEKYTSELESKMEARTTELARRVSQLMTINKISRAVTSILDPDELMAEFVKSISQGFGYQHVFLMLMDKERGDLYLKTFFGREMEMIPRDMRLKLKEGIIGHAAYFGETLVSGNVDADPRYIRKALIGTKSELAVPVTFRGEILGILDVQSDIRDTFTRNDVNILEMLGDMLANSITNARVYTEAKEREAALSVLDRISKQISYRLEPSVVLDQVSRDATTLLKAEKAMVGLVDDRTNTISWVSPYRINKEKIRGLRFKADLGVTGRALKMLKAEISNDYMTDSDASERDAELFEIKSLIVAPMIIEGRGIGTINVYNKLDGRPFTKSDALFLSSLADHAAIALENANLVSSLNQRVRSQLALLETALTMQRQVETSSVYELVANKLREVVWNDEITFYKVSPDRSLLVPVYSKGPYTREIMADSSLHMGQGITGAVALTGMAELVNDTNADPRVVQVPGTPTETEAMMAIPLVGKERIIGVLAMYRDGGPVFTETEFEIAQLFASQATVAVENAELYRARETLLVDSKSKVEQMAKVLDLTISVMYMDDLDKLLQRCVDAVVQSFGFVRAAAFLLDFDRDVFVMKAMAGYPSWVNRGDTRTVQNVLEDLDDGFRIGSTSYYVKYEDQSYGIESFTFIAHPELADKPRATPDAWHERDILRFVFKDRSGRLIGYLLVDEPTDGKIPTKDHIEVLEILGGIASIAVENSKAYERQVLAANEIALLNDLMTHDINNFNQGIMGYIELLLQDKRLDDNQRRYADRALLQVRNNARLIDNIRKLAKVRMMSDSEFVPVDLQKAISEAVEMVARANPDKKITLASQLIGDTHYVMANDYIRELFQNIISNAVKFDSSKRVKIEAFIAEETTASGASWVVSVADRGRGIPDDRKNAVFERFATGMTGIKGFGLGLS
ncbi:MAG TPA: GAF domain-containing protein, partial [Thermoplasmata archaeon]|nr:GAF domain-containing protein [Thermoplasmata archaeon]